LLVNFHTIKAMATSAASPPATDKPTMVLVEIPVLPELLSGALLDDGVGVGVSTEETITWLVIVTTSPSCWVLAILVSLVDVWTTGGDVGVVIGGGVELLEGGRGEEEGEEDELLGLAARKWRKWWASAYN
jgi:hypothetical protein